MRGRSRTPWNRLFRALPALAAALAASSCASSKKPPPQLAPPPIELTIDHYVGTPLTGPRPQAPPAQIAPADAADVRVVVCALADVPRQAQGLRPIGSHAALLTAALGDRAVMASPRLAADAMVATGDDADALLASARSGALGLAAELSTLNGALPHDITARVAAVDPPSAISPGRGVEVELFEPSVAKPAAATAPATAPSDNVRIALSVTDLAELPAPPTTEPPPADEGGKKKQKSGSSRNPPKPAPVQPRVMRQESILLTEPLSPAAGGRVVLVVPFRFSGSPSKALLLHVQVKPGDPNDPAHADATKRALADAARSAQAVAAREKVFPGATPMPADIRAGAFATLAGATDDASRRAALLYLADRTDSPAAADVALVADGPTLAALSQSIAEAATKTDPALAAADPGWLVDRTTLALLSQRLSGEALSPELTAALVRRAGDLARRPDTLAELLKLATGTKDLDNRIEAENLIALEDSAPAARVRAYDYLAARGNAPAGYDPLAAAKARRSALDKARQAPPPAAATQPATAPTARATR